MENVDSKGKTLKPALSGEWGVNTASGSSWTYDWNKISCRIFVKVFAKIRFLCQRNASGNMQNLAKFPPQNFFTFKAKNFFPFVKKAQNNMPQTNIKILK